MPRLLRTACRVLECLRTSCSSPCTEGALPYRSLCPEIRGQHPGRYSTLPFPPWKDAREDVQEGSTSEDKAWHQKEPLTVFQVDWDGLRRPAELIGGKLWFRDSSTRPSHAHLQRELLLALHAGYPSWELYPTVSVRYGQANQFDHDLAGWRNKAPFAPGELEMCTSRPDFVCEVVSSVYEGSGDKQMEERDTVHKLEKLAWYNVPHYWLFFSVRRKVERYELQRDRDGNTYKLMESVNTATGKVRWAPFEHVELDLDVLFGKVPV